MSLFIKSHSNIFTLKSEVTLPMSISTAWDFFSSPHNLSKVTPPEMNFLITSGPPKKAYAGQIISYKVNVLKYFRLNWVTEITQVEFEQYFIDEQRFGPYKMWHHEHLFEPVDANNCKMTDIVSYKLPYGLLGKLGHKLFVKKQLRTIFEYRTQQIKSLTGS